MALILRAGDYRERARNWRFFLVGHGTTVAALNWRLWLSAWLLLVSYRTVTTLGLWLSSGRLCLVPTPWGTSCPWRHGRG
jgi:hypothetical protein